MQNCLKRRVTLVALVIFVVMFTSSSSTATNEFNIDRICQELLERTSQAEPGVKNADTREMELLTEVHSLSSLYTFGPSSFVRQHPTVIMSAPQVLAAMIIARGYTVVDLPWLKTGPIRRWNFNNVPFVWETHSPEIIERSNSEIYYADSMPGQFHVRNHLNFN
jgi:hypothetical protein